jgi:hypothetical protein
MYLNVFKEFLLISLYPFLFIRFDKYLLYFFKEIAVI